MVLLLLLLRIRMTCFLKASNSGKIFRFHIKLIKKIIQFENNKNSLRQNETPELNLQQFIYETEKRTRRENGGEEKD